MPVVGTGDQPYTGQISTFQSVSDGQAPQSGLRFSGDGTIARPCLAFPPATAVNPADGFLLEPDLQAGGMQLRALSLASGQPFLPSPGQSFGSFTGTLDDLAIHPAGYAAALSIATSTLQVVRIGALAPDASAPAAAIYAGQGTRPGLLSDPAAVACSLDKILVLQTSPQYAQGCIAAFDFKGNPVNCFGSGQSVMPLHPEGTASVWPLGIYAPGGGFLAQVAGLAAARLQVDLWRNVFTLNYEIVPGSGRTEPSVAQWIPSTPPGTPA